MQALQVTLFSDGRPGHEKQSLGIVSALRSYVDVKQRQVKVPEHAFMGELGSHLSYLLHVDHFLGSGETLKSDLLIGTGSRTHLPMLRAARRSSAKIVTCMNPVFYLRAKFNLCCVPLHDQVKPAENIFLTVGPPNMSQISTMHDSSKSLVLIGGKDEDSHSWDERLLVSQLESLINHSDQMSWIISSSPRTPASTEELLRRELGQLPLVTFVPFAETGSGWVEDMYGTHGSVWITADSISMVYEALSAGCRVGVVPVKWKKKNNKFQRSIDYLRDERRIVMLSEYLQGETEWLGHEPLNEADRCAREILRRWWPKDIQ